MTTKERLALAAWWPTKLVETSEGFAGSAACAECHAGIVKSQAGSQMAHTLTPAGGSQVLHQHLRQEYRSGAYVYSLARHGETVETTVSDGAAGDDRAASDGAVSDRAGTGKAASAGAASESADLAWAFGSGEVGQSYLWQGDAGSFREARFNYFASMKGFGATPGRLHGPPATLEMALGRRIEGFEATTCFACHTTAMTRATPVTAKSFVPGIGCEACHGPGVEHIAAMRGRPASGGDGDLHIVSPAEMTPVQSVDFCGACHSTPWDVRMMGATGLQTVRFPAYRLEKSRCWGVQGDMRLTCQGCHDPHQPLQREAASYDAACLRCHGTGTAAHTDRVSAEAARVAETVAATVATPAATPWVKCPVAQTRCVTCHMPKYELPEMHAQFTDHMIRVVRNPTLIPD